MYSTCEEIFKISSTAPFVINSSLPSELFTATDKRLRAKSNGISSNFIYPLVWSTILYSLARFIIASSILLLSPVCKLEFKYAYFKTPISSSPLMSRYFSKTILSSVNVPVLSVHKMFIAPKFCIASSFFIIVFFLDIFTAPFDRHDDNITGRSNGVIAIAIATANVKAVTILCFEKLSIKTIGIIISINLINNLLILSIPF